MYKFLALFVLVVSITGCSKQQAIVQIIQIVDEFNNIPIESVDISISSAEIPGRDKGDLYDWDLKYPINIPIEVGEVPAA